MGYGLVIWDFNGTIADDVALGVEAVNSMLKERGLRQISSTEEYRRLLRFPIKEYYKDIGFDFSKEPYESLAEEWFRLYLAGVSDIKAVLGAPELINDIYSAGIPQIVLSASESALLLRQLSMFGIAGCFAEIIGSDNIYAAGKLEAARHVARRYSGKSVMIGDTVHDKEAADIIGADCILYTGGHGSRADIIKSGAAAADSMTDVKKLIFR